MKGVTLDRDDGGRGGGTAIGYGRRRCAGVFFGSGLVVMLGILECDERKELLP